MHQHNLYTDDMERLTLDEVLVKQNLILPASRLDVPVPRRTLQVVDLDRTSADSKCHESFTHLGEAPVREQVLRDQQVHLRRLGFTHSLVRVRLLER